MRIKITISYDGTSFFGWQSQTGGNTIEQALENALFTLTDEKIKVIGSGRTDSGVHALGQVAHFDVTNSAIPPKKFAVALNTLLPDEIKVLKSERADENFNARKSAKRKTYIYSMYLSDFILPLKERYALMVGNGIDISAMRKAAELFIGEHDFKCFTASGSSAKNTVRTIYSIDIVDNYSSKKATYGCENDLVKEIKIYVTGNGFLYNMVRMLSGALLAVAEKKVTLDDLKNTLTTGIRPKKMKTLAAKGLCLYKVEYE